MLIQGCSSGGSDGISSGGLLYIADEWIYTVTNSNCPETVIGTGEFKFTVSSSDPTSYESVAYKSNTLNHIYCTTSPKSGSSSSTPPMNIQVDAPGLWGHLPKTFAFNMGEPGTEHVNIDVPIYSDTFIQFVEILSDSTVTTISLISQGHPSN